MSASYITLAVPFLPPAALAQEGWARYVYKDCLPRFVKFARNVMHVEGASDEETALKGIPSDRGAGRW